ncbi:MAG: acyltransferase family protein [Verrucomicrobia bacterium]|nr:acyltransferase family protein [Verrucomicrobiota bacterium]
MSTSDPHANPDSGERLHALDALRAFAMLLGIVLHAGIAYAVVPLGPWPKDAQRSLVFDVLLVAIHGFRMPLIFLIAGFFARLLYHRLGPRGFVPHRAQRILAPFVAGLVALVPLVSATLVFAQNRSWEAVKGLLQPRLFMRGHTVHLWFLYYLLMLYALALVSVPLARRMIPERAVRSPWKSLALAIPTAALLWFGELWVDIGLPLDLMPMPRVLVYYGLFFGFGWWLHRQAHLLEALRDRVRGELIAAGPVFLVVLACGSFQAQVGHPHYRWFKLGCVTAFSLYTWLAVFGLLGLFLRHLNRRQPAIRYLADSSYWLYLTHLPLVLWLQIWLTGYAWPIWLKFILVNGLTTGVLLLSYHFLVRYTFVGATLNGPRE